MITKYMRGAATAICCVAIATACYHDDEALARNELREGGVIDIAASFQSYTRVSGANFDDGDKIGVFVVDYEDSRPRPLATAGNRADNAPFTLDETVGVWSAPYDIYWKDGKTPADFYGYYPYSSQIDDVNNYLHAVAADQSQSGSDNRLGGYESSDLLWAKHSGATAAEGEVSLVFNHLLAGVEIRLQPGSGFDAQTWSDLQKTVLLTQIPKTASVNLADGSAEVLTNEYISVKPFDCGSDTYRAVVHPHIVAAGRNIISITIDGQSYFLSKEQPTELLQGKMHTFTITVDRREESGDYLCSLADFSITAWIDSEEFREGITRQYVVVTVDAAGNLEECMKAAGIDASTVRNLKIVGELNHDDYLFIGSSFEQLMCVNLKDVIFLRDDTTPGFSVKENDYEYSYSGDYVVPGGLFYGKSTLSKVILPDKIRGIGHQAFLGTSLIGDLRIPEGTEFIGVEAFHSTMLFGELVLPSTLKVLGGSLFRFGCRFNSQLQLPEGLEYIGGNAFSDCGGFSGQLILPENIKYYGEGAFGGCKFTGDLVLPQGMKIIPDGLFDGCSFDGNLSIPEGVVEIGNSAFRGTHFRGELVLPSTLRVIGNDAFSDNRFTSVVFNDNLSRIGISAFSGNRLTGELVIPAKVRAVFHRTFENNQLLSNVVLHENVTLIEEFAFAECAQLNGITCHAATPPVIRSDSFENVPKDNFTLEVPSESVAAYQSDRLWSEFRRIAAYSNFVCRPTQACALNSMSRIELVLNSDGDWEVEACPEWCSLSQNAGSTKTNIMLTINEMASGSADMREGDVVFRLKGTEFTTACHVSQCDYEYDEDEMVVLQRASRGNGSLNVIFVGDGFDAQSIADGSYMAQVREQTEYFFGIFPYNVMRDCFNVKAMVALSQDTGINTPNTYRNTRFSTNFGGIPCGGGSGSLAVDGGTVFDYIVDHNAATRNQLTKSVVILIPNTTEYSAVTQLYDDGSAISICPASERAYPSDTRGTVQHEACGHGFGKLGDETIIKNNFATAGVKQDVEQKHFRGWYQNLSANGKMSDVPWSHFIFDPRYSNEVDIFEGGMGFTRGIYRSEINSCMNYGIPYFNAISRQSIMQRICDYAEIGFSMEWFYQNDSKEWGDTQTATRAPGREQTFVPYTASGLHHEPVVISAQQNR